MRVRDVQAVTFGTMDATITILGVMLGLVVFADKNILLTAMFATGVADSFANASGMYAIRTSEKRKTQSQSVSYCFAATLTVTIMLVLPIVLFPIDLSPYITATFAVFLLAVLGAFASKKAKRDPYKLAGSYVVIGIIVSLITYLIGLGISGNI